MKTKSFKAYFSLLRMSVIESLQYRMSALTNGVISVFYALIEITIFSVFFLHGANRVDGSLSLTLSQMVSYIWLKQAMYTPTGIYNEFLTKIKTGDVGLELCRPWDLYTHWFAKLTAWRIGGFGWRALFTIAAGLLMPASYRLGAPESSMHLVMYIVSTISSLFLWQSYHMLVTSIRMGITWGDGPIGIMFLFSNLLSGVYLPLQLWPEFMQSFLYYQPFAGAIDLPIRLYVGSLPLAQAGSTIAIQLIWGLLFVVIGRALMQRKLHKLIVQGG